ncbi:MAG TPA: c-type cytochrome biogenesis protein CcmI [Rhodocyclaceae bacterium]
MIPFWIVAGSLVVGAMLLVLPALLGRGEARHPAAAMLSSVVILHQQLDELDADLATGVLAPANYEQARRELEARLMEETEPGLAERQAAPTPVNWRRLVAPIAVALLLSAGVAALYLRIGTPDALRLDTGDIPAGAASADGSAHPVNPQQVQLMVTRLVDRLQRNPQDADGWAMLARSYGMMQRFSDSAIAFSKALALKPDDPQLLVDYADTLAMAQGRSFTGKPLELIERALKFDPGNPKGLALAGTAAFEAKAYAQAVETWQKLLSRLPETSAYAASIRSSIAEARQLGGLAAPKGDQGAAATRVAIRGTVGVVAQLAGRVSPGDTVYVFARAANSRGAPLAVVRRSASELPFDFVLDDAAATAPDMKLSTFRGPVIVGALVSKSGNPSYQSGDLVAQEQPVKADQAKVALLIRGIVR